MIKPVFRFLTFLSFSVGLAIALPAIPIHAAGGGGGGGGAAPTEEAPPPSKSNSMKSTHKAKKAKQSLFDDPAFAKGYREAYATIYDQHDYVPQMKLAFEALAALIETIVAPKPNVVSLRG